MSNESNWAKQKKSKLPSGVRKEVSKLIDALNNSIGPTDAGGTHDSSRPEILLSLDGAQVHLKQSGSRY